MSTQKCTLCELETSDPPIKEKDIDGVFCCHGCLHVYKLLQDIEEDKAKQLKNKTIELRKKGQTETPLPESYEEAFFKVDGMHCGTCESFLESIAKRQDGIYKSEASYASEMIKIYYDQERINLDDLSERLSKMGYNLRDLNTQADEDNANDAVRIIIGGFFGRWAWWQWPAILSISLAGNLIPADTRQKLKSCSPYFIAIVGVILILRGLGLGIPFISPIL